MTSSPETVEAPRRATAKSPTRLLRPLVHIGAAIPGLLTGWAYLNDNLTVNPIQALEQRTGYYAILLLACSLACTPLSNLFGWKTLLALRRPLGLWAFAYAVVHVATFFVLDYGLDLGLILADVATKRYILVGLATFLLLLPLALTSTKGWMRRLGRNWKRLHRLVYLAAPLAVIHWVWSVKADYRQPLLVGGVIALFLILRLPVLRRTLSKQR